MTSIVSQIKGILNELYDSRNIMVALISKDLFGKYKNSLLGFAWHFVIPLVMLFVYYVVFSALRPQEFDYFIVFLAAALFPFNFMTSNLAGGAGQVTGNQGMVKKMYFPREILVYSHIISQFIIMLIGLLIVLIYTLLAGFELDPVSLLCLPFVFFFMLLFVTGYSLIFQSLNVYWRDVQYLLQSFTMIFFFITPMYFDPHTVGGTLGKIVWLNPFTYYVQATRDCIYYGTMPSTHILLICVLLGVVFFVIGSVVFRLLKRGFVERL